MPKYKNISTNPVNLYRDNRTISPGEITETIFFYPDLEANKKIELIDIKPYISPVSKSEIIRLTGDNRQVKIDLYDNKFKLHSNSIFMLSLTVLNVSGADYVYLMLNEESNKNEEIHQIYNDVYFTNTIKLIKGTSIQLHNRNLIKYLIFRLPDEASEAIIDFKILNPFSEFFF